MSKEKELLKIQTTISKKFDTLLRRHAYTLRMKNNEILEVYQDAYIEKLEREKEAKKAEKAQKEQKNQEKETKKES